MALRHDSQFLLEGNVFSESFINSYIALRENDIQQLRTLVHPIEFAMYYSL